MEQMEGFEYQRRSIQEQLSIVRDEAARKMSLLTKGLANWSDYTILLRSEADLVGQQGQADAAIMTARSYRSRHASNLRNWRITCLLQKAAAEINDVRAETLPGAGRRNCAPRVTAWNAPWFCSLTGGVVVRLSLNSVGGVISAGEVLAEILPTGGTFGGRGPGVEPRGHPFGQAGLACRPALCGPGCARLSIG